MATAGLFRVRPLTTAEPRAARGPGKCKPIPTLALTGAIRLLTVRWSQTLHRLRPSTRSAQAYQVASRPRAIGQTARLRRFRIRRKAASDASIEGTSRSASAVSGELPVVRVIAGAFGLELAGGTHDLGSEGAQLPGY